MNVAVTATNEPVKGAETESKPSKDRFFNPWRTPASEDARALVQQGIEEIMNFEKVNRLRKRARKCNDQLVFEKTVTALICDLAYNDILGNHEIVVSRSNRELGLRSRYRSVVMGRKLPTVLDLLADEKLGWSVQVLGYRTPFTRYQRTCISVGPRLRSEVERRGLDISDFTSDPDQEVIILRSPKEHGRSVPTIIEYEDDEKTKHMRTELGEINAWLRGSEITLLPGYGHWTLDGRQRQLRRIFTRGTFNSGGRLYGGFWQDMKKVDRRQGILIDGETTVELDYGQMAPRMLYALAGEVPPEDDAYTVNKYQPAELFREGFKKLLNSLLFAEKPLSRKPKETKNKLPNVPIDQLVAELKEKHKPIADLFCQGIGHAIQYYESELMVDLLSTAVSAGIVALPIHDAIIVKRSHAAEAEMIMMQIFEKRTGVNAIVRREDK